MSISISHLTKKYGTQKAVDNISFEIKSGEIVGFIGPNGAGKSTTMKVITGFLSDFEGDVTVLGHNVKTEALEVKKRIGYLPEHNPLYTDMYVHEYLRFIAKMYGIEGNISDAVSHIISQTGLSKEQHKKIAALSKGYRQRVGLASVLLHNPDVLILDEPTTGLDPNQIVEIRNLIAEVGKEKTVMLSTHIMQEVEAICNRVIIINNGSIVANDNSQSIKNHSNTSATILVEFIEDCSIEILQALPNIKEVVAINSKKYLCTPIGKHDIRQEIFACAVQHNITVISLQLQEKSLEEAFRDLTKNPIL